MFDLEISEEKLKDINVPAIALVGAQDPIVVHVRNLSKLMPQLEVSVIPGGNHMNAFALPLFLEKLTAFLEANRSPEAGTPARPDLG